jgi:hypothetical protein
VGHGTEFDYYLGTPESGSGLKISMKNLSLSSIA